MLSIPQLFSPRHPPRRNLNAKRANIPLLRNRDSLANFWPNIGHFRQICRESGRFLSELRAGGRRWPFPGPKGGTWAHNFLFPGPAPPALSGESVVLRFFSGLECAPNTASVRPIAGYLDGIVEEWRKNRCTALLQLAQLFRETLHKSQPPRSPHDTRLPLRLSSGNGMGVRAVD
jgi:hypothetical protein